MYTAVIRREEVKYNLEFLVADRLEVDYDSEEYTAFAILNPVTVKTYWKEGIEIKHDSYRMPQYSTHSDIAEVVCEGACDHRSWIYTAIVFE